MAKYVVLFFNSVKFPNTEPIYLCILNWKAGWKVCGALAHLTGFGIAHTIVYDENTIHSSWEGFKTILKEGSFTEIALNLYSVGKGS